MDQQQADPAQPSALPRARRNWKLLVAAGIVVLALVGATVWAMAASSSFTASGSLMLRDFKGGGVQKSDSGGCVGSRGYSDIRTGTAVTVYDAAGKVLAVGSLTSSEPVESSSSATGLIGCLFRLSVDGVPRGEKFYQFEVAHRGKVTVTPDDAKAGHASMTLGP